MEKGVFLYAIEDKRCILKPVGRIEFTMSVALDAFIRQILENSSIEQILVDLTETTHIDSTNLGILARLKMAVFDPPVREPVIFFTNTVMHEIVQYLGFDKLFPVVTGKGVKTENLAGICNPACDAFDMRSLVLDAHRYLSAMNNNNREMFKDVIHYLEHDAEGTGREID